jgi:hypothetical protein
MNRKSCRHFTGILAKKCEAGIAYQRPLQRVCIGEPGECEKFSPYTKEEIEADEAATKRCVELMQRGLSSCCEAPIDESHVIREGRHKGHGPRYCSKCGRCCFMV